MFNKNSIIQTEIRYELRNKIEDQLQKSISDYVNNIVSLVIWEKTYPEELIPIANNVIG